MQEVIKEINPEVVTTIEEEEDMVEKTRDPPVKYVGNKGILLLSIITDTMRVTWDNHLQMSIGSILISKDR